MPTFAKKSPARSTIKKATKKGPIKSGRKSASSRRVAKAPSSRGR